MRKPGRKGVVDFLLSVLPWLNVYKPGLVTSMSIDIAVGIRRIIKPRDSTTKNEAKETLGIPQRYVFLLVFNIHS